MRAGQLGFNLLGRGLVFLSFLLASPQVIEAQVGITSGMAQVALVARAAPRGSIQSVSGERETGRAGSVRESSITVQMTANSGYSLIVRGTAQTVGVASHVWVRTVDGEFQELKAGSSAIVARETQGAGQLERQVQYRIDSSVANEQGALPVYYELRINPTI